MLCVHMGVHMQRPQINIRTEPIREDFYLCTLLKPLSWIYCTHACTHMHALKHPRVHVCHDSYVEADNLERLFCSGFQGWHQPPLAATILSLLYPLRQALTVPSQQAMLSLPLKRRGRGQPCLTFSWVLLKIPIQGSWLMADIATTPASSP